MNINTFTSHELPQVREAATKIQEYSSMLSNHSINELQYHSLCETVLDVQRIENDMQDMSQRDSVIEAIKQLALVVGIFR